MILPYIYGHFGLKHNIQHCFAQNDLNKVIMDIFDKFWYGASGKNRNYLKFEF